MFSSDLPQYSSTSLVQWEATEGWFNDVKNSPFLFWKGPPLEVHRHRVIFRDVCTLLRYVHFHAICTATDTAVACRQVPAMCLLLLISRTRSAHSPISLHTSTKRDLNIVFILQFGKNEKTCKSYTYESPGDKHEEQNSIDVTLSLESNF